MSVILGALQRDGPALRQVAVATDAAEREEELGAPRRTEGVRCDDHVRPRFQ
jgi:hypothetical protein